MRILLHIGQSKTGTSAIQAYLTLNRECLREAGILYPGITIGGMPVDLGSHNSLADALVGLSRYPNLTADQYFGQFFGEANGRGIKVMVLSAEHFFGGEPRIWDIPDERTYFDRYSNKIEALARYLDGHDVTFLVYLRPQVDWLESAISQTIRVERLITDKAIYHDDYQFFEMAKPVLRYSTLIDTWVEGLRPRHIMVVPYERHLLHKKSTIADFLHRTGLDYLDLPFADEGLRVNQSLSWEYIEVKKMLNRIPKNKTDERIIITCLERLSARNESNETYRISEELSQEIERFVEPENARLNERYVKGGSQLRARGWGYQRSDSKRLSEVSITEAMAAFEREYAKPRTQILKIDYKVRAFLRGHAKPIHSTLHQLKRAYRKHVYRQ